MDPNLVNIGCQQIRFANELWLIPQMPVIPLSQDIAFLHVYLHGYAIQLFSPHYSGVQPGMTIIQN